MFDLIYSLAIALNLHLSSDIRKQKTKNAKTKLSHQITIFVMQTNKPFSPNELQIAAGTVLQMTL